MTTILPLSRSTVLDAAMLIRNLRTAMNGKVVCSTDEVAEVLTMALDHAAYRGFIAYGQKGGLQGYIGIDERSCDPHVEEIDAERIHEERDEKLMSKPVQVRIPPVD